MPDSEIELPGLLGEIEEIAGRNTAIKLAIACGGTRIYVPAHMPQEHWLAETIGYYAAATLCKHFTFGRRGIRLDVPMIPRGEQIKSLTEAGRSSRDIALKLGIHQRTVHAHRRRLRKPTQPKFRSKGSTFL